MNDRIYQIKFHAWSDRSGEGSIMTDLFIAPSQVGYMDAQELEQAITDHIQERYESRFAQYGALLYINVVERVFWTGETKITKPTVGGKYQMALAVNDKSAVGKLNKLLEELVDILLEWAKIQQPPF